jgi:AcrR family transcriptional regulator
MRKVADRLEVGTMSLYTYVPNKADLLVLMIDAVYEQLYDSVEAPAQQPGGWQAALHFIAQRNWELYRQHPWLLSVTDGRPILGPHLSLKYEAELRPLDHLGLSDVEMDAVLTLVLTHVEGCARVQATLDQTRQDSGLSDAEWWADHAPLLEELIDPGDFPVATRVGISAGEQHQGPANPAYALAFGLERIIVGVAILISDKYDENA